MPFPGESGPITGAAAYAYNRPIPDMAKNNETPLSNNFYTQDVSVMDRLNRSSELYGVIHILTFSKIHLHEHKYRGTMNK